MLPLAIAQAAGGVAAQATKANRAFYPQALVVLTARLESLKPPSGFELHPRYGGALRALNSTVMAEVRPLSVKVVRNSYQQPDSFSVEIDARALPITPKQIATCAVEVYLWGAPSADAQWPVDPEGNSLVAPLCVGLVDDVSSRYGPDGHTIAIEGQDYTALFSMREWDPRRRAPAGLRLDLQLEQLLAEGDKGGQMRLRVEPESLRSSLPVVGAAARRTNSKGQPVREKSSWWDVMYRMAQLNGYILFVDGLDVVLTQPQVLHAYRAAGAVPVYRFAWGRNLEVLELQRHLGKERQPVIEVRSYDERTRQTVIGRYPRGQEAPLAGLAVKRSTSASNVQKDTVKRYTLHGVTDQATLDRYARAVFELIAQGEQSVTFTSDDLVDRLGHDALRMRSGDAVQLDVDVYNLEELENQPAEVREKRLLDAGFQPSVAAYFARNAEAVRQFGEPFRIRQVTYDFDVDQGLAIEVECQQYVQLEGA